MLNKEYNDKLIQLGAELEETEKLKFGKLLVKLIFRSWKAK